MGSTAAAFLLLGIFFGLIFMDSGGEFSMELTVIKFEWMNKFLGISALNAGIEAM